MVYQKSDEDSSGKHFEKKEEKKIQHDHKCENCGDPATVNYQLVWVSWTINPDGDIITPEFQNVDTGELWCDRCWELDRKEEYKKLKEIRDEWNANLSKL